MNLGLIRNSDNNNEQPLKMGSCRITQYAKPSSLANRVGTKVSGVYSTHNASHPLNGRYSVSNQGPQALLSLADGRTVGDTMHNKSNPLKEKVRNQEFRSYVIGLALNLDRNDRINALKSEVDEFSDDKIRKIRLLLAKFDKNAFVDIVRGFLRGVDGVKQSEMAVFIEEFYFKVLPLLVIRSFSEKHTYLLDKVLALYFPNLGSRNIEYLSEEIDSRFENWLPGIGELLKEG